MQHRTAFKAGRGRVRLTSTAALATQRTASGAVYKEAIPWEQWVLPPTAVAGPLDCVPPADSSSGYSDAPTVPLLSSSVTITLAGSGSGTRVSQAAAARYQLLLRAAGSAAGVVTKVVVTVQASNSSLGMGTNYSYSIISGTTTTTTTNTASAGVEGLNAAAAVNVLAATPFAVAYAMETLLQLAAPAAQKICGGGFTVVDEPTYVHRGILLDTGRRFFPTAVVKTTIESMAMFKLNDEIKDIVDFAYLRGVRVVPEFEMPGKSHQ
eukprot:gene3693-10456_t